MNIAPFTNTCFPQVNGVSNTVDMMIKNLLSLAHHVHLFVPKYPEETIYQNMAWGLMPTQKNNKYSMIYSFF